MATARAESEAQANAAAFSPCRGLGHSWQHHPGRREGGVVIFESDCTHCTASRTKFLSRMGVIVRPARYRYPAGYSQKGDDRLSTLQWRRILVRSVVGS
jgi:hypothetical protein